MHSSFRRALKHLVTRDEEKVSALNDVWKKMSRLYREVFGLVQFYHERYQFDKATTFTRCVSDPTYEHALISMNCF